MPEVDEVERETEVGPECRTSNPRRPVSRPYREAISHPCPLAYQAFFTFRALLSLPPSLVRFFANYANLSIEKSQNLHRLVTVLQVCRGKWEGMKIF